MEPPVAVQRRTRTCFSRQLRQLRVLGLRFGLLREGGGG